MKRGDKVYKVVPSLNMNRHWFVQERTLVVCSDKQVRLDDFFCGGGNLIFQPTAIGREFHETPAAAVKAYTAARNRNAEVAREALRRAEADAQAAFMWATAWAEEGEPVHVVDDPSPITKDML